MMRNDRRLDDVEPLEERTVGAAQAEDDRVRIGGLDRLDEVAQRRPRARVVLEQRRLERESDVGRRERRAVVPANATPQGEAVDAAAFFDTPALGELGNGRQIFVEADETVEDLIGHRMGGARGRDGRIQRARIAADGDHQRRRRAGVDRGAAAGGQRGRRQPRQQATSRAHERIVSHGSRAHRTGQAPGRPGHAILTSSHPHIS
jgi:hypothetical protein